MLEQISFDSASMLKPLWLFTNDSTAARLALQRSCAHASDDITMRTELVAQSRQANQVLAQRDAPPARQHHRHAPPSSAHPSSLWAQSHGVVMGAFALPQRAHPTEQHAQATSYAPSTTSMEGVLMTLPLKMSAMNLLPLVRRKILGSGRSGVYVSRRSTARGLRDAVVRGNRRGKHRKVSRGSMCRLG